MKRQVLLSLLMICVLTTNSGAQEWYNTYYPSRSLSELSSDELSYLLERSNQTITTGKVITIVGVGLTTIGCVVLFKGIITLDFLVGSREQYYNAFGIVMLTGLASTTIGVPTIIVGSGRKRTVQDVMNSLQQNAVLRIIPSIHISNVRAYSPGITFSISF